MYAHYPYASWCGLSIFLISSFLKKRKKTTCHCTLGWKKGTWGLWHPQPTPETYFGSKKKKQLGLGNAWAFECDVEGLYLLSTLVIWRPLSGLHWALQSKGRVARGLRQPGITFEYGFFFEGFEHNEENKFPVTFSNVLGHNWPSVWMNGISGKTREIWHGSGLQCFLENTKCLPCTNPHESADGCLQWARQVSAFGSHWVVVNFVSCKMRGKFGATFWFPSKRPAASL